MSKKETLDADLNTNESKELLKQIAQTIQIIDEEIFDLGERRKDIFKNAKSQGFNDAILKKAISLLRKPVKDEEVSEQEIYVDVIENIITPLK